MAVEFDKSGNLSIKTQFDGVTKSGVVSIVDLELGESVFSDIFEINSGSNTVPYSIENMHTSKDNYAVCVGGRGITGYSKVYSGLSPTEEVAYERFQDSYTPLVSGEEIVYNDFESATTSGLNITTHGSSITSSGLTANNTMQGDYYVGLSANTGSLHIEPTSISGTGLLSGRTIFLVKNGTATTTSSQAAGFAFLRQGSALGSNAYKVYMTTDTAQSNRHVIRLSYGQLSSATNGTLNFGTTIRTFPIYYETSNIRDFLKRHWVCVEWEVDTALEGNVKIAIYHKTYKEGDTIESVRNSLQLLEQFIWNGGSSAGFYTTTSEPVRWIIGSNGNINVGIDCIYLESIDNMTDAGTLKNKFKVIKSSKDSTTTKAYLTNRLYFPDLGISKLEGQNLYSEIFNNSINHLISREESIHHKIGSGYRGVGCRRAGGTTTSVYPFLSFLLNYPNGLEIDSGVFRAALAIEAVDGNAKFGFSFLRQGSSYTSNCYTVEFYLSSTGNYRVRVRKGAIITSYGISSNFVGSILGTSSNIPTLVTGSELIFGWLEVRWLPTTSPSNSTDIQVLFNYINPVPNIDRSPGNVDYKLNSILNITDTASPYINTSEGTIVTMVTEGGSIVTHQLELRKYF